MNLQDEIKTMTLGFFQNIGSEIIEDKGAYKVSIPDKYKIYFQDANLLFTFDEKIASEKGLHLIIPGSNILSLIITNCKQKGPITIKKSKTSIGNMIIRYHFFINFSGIFNLSKLEYVDVDLNTSKLANVYDVLERVIFSLEERVDPKRVTSSYIIALDEIQRRCVEITTNFLQDANKEFQHDFELFVDKYDSQIRELDDSINKKTVNFDDPEKIKEFRFDIVDKIHVLEKEKKLLIVTLQEKHKILLEYGLVACEIITN